MVYLISAMLSKSIVDIDSMTLLEMGAKYNPLISRGEVWRLFTAAFLHGGILHLACNMYSLYAVGTQVERIYGKVKYIIIYILSVIALNLYIGFTIPNIDNYAHIGGLIVGIIISIILTFNID